MKFNVFFSYEKFKAQAADDNGDGIPDSIDFFTPPNFPWVTIVDNLIVPDQPFTAVRNGAIRPNTPISWNYAKDDAWLFTPESYEYVAKKLVPSFASEITAAQATTGFIAPPPYQNELFKIAFQADQAIANEFNAIYGCQNNQTDCIEQFGLLMQGLSWVCNTKHAFSGIIKENPSKYGAIYPMEFGRPNCVSG